MAFGANQFSLMVELLEVAHVTAGKMVENGFLEEIERAASRALLTVVELPGPAGRAVSDSICDVFG